MLFKALLQGDDPIGRWKFFPVRNDKMEYDQRYHNKNEAKYNRYVNTHRDHYSPIIKKYIGD